MPWNQWQISHGMSGRFPLESVAALVRNKRVSGFGDVSMRGTIGNQSAVARGANLANREFLEFVRRKTARVQAESEAIDWGERRADWLRELGELYVSMEDHLRPFTKAHEIQIERTPIQLREDYLGTYDADKLTFKIGRDKIVAKPVGILLIGARGRVDLSGPRKTLKIVLLDEGGPVLTNKIEHGGVAEESSHSMVRGNVEDAGWYIETTPPNSVVVAFGEESFRDAIMEVSGG